jgi:pyridinium-3,5-biscarboxylic acid mononucleotide synthase
MFEETLRQLLTDVKSGAVSADEAVAQLRRLPFTQAGDALVDHHRTLRSGTPEAIYGPGKSPEQCALIVGEMLIHGEGPVLLTRVDDSQVKAALAAHPGSQRASNTLAWRLPESPTGGHHRVLVISAGTADVPVVDECMLTLRAYGYAPDRIVDVGVAGIHRLLSQVDTIQAADVIVVAAGMEGALASVIGGLTGVPVVAIPTSVGYGASLEGVTALLAMHASCAAGVTVVGIDNGFGAAAAVARILGRR